MKTSRDGLMRRAVLIGGALLFAIVGTTAEAQTDYPNKPIKVIVPFAAGSGFDTIARFTVQKLSEVLGQTVFVENQGGAGGVVGSQAVARAPKDGYTLIFHSVSSAAANAQIYKNLPYDTVKDFAPISLISEYPLVMIINPEVPAKTLPEFIALLKAKPETYNYGSSGIGSGIHLAAELFKALAEVDIQHIPYKGTAPATTDLLAGRIQMSLAAVPSAVDLIKAGKLRALAVTTTKRSAALPDVPTMVEGGLAGYDVPYWNGIYAPAGTPRAIIDKLAEASARAVRDPATIARFKELGADPVGSTPEELDRFWKEQLALYGRIAKAANIQLEMQ